MVVFDPEATIHSVKMYKYTTKIISIMLKDVHYRTSRGSNFKKIFHQI